MNFHHYGKIANTSNLKERNVKKKMTMSLRPADPLELELQAITLALRNHLRSSGRAADALDSGVTSPAPSRK